MEKMECTWLNLGTIFFRLYEIGKVGKEVITEFLMVNIGTGNDRVYLTPMLLLVLHNNGFEIIPASGHQPGGAEC